MIRAPHWIAEAIPEASTLHMKATEARHRFGVREVELRSEMVGARLLRSREVPTKCAMR